MSASPSTPMSAPAVATGVPRHSNSTTRPSFWRTGWLLRPQHGPAQASLSERIHRRRDRSGHPRCAAGLDRASTAPNVVRGDAHRRWSAAHSTAFGGPAQVALQPMRRIDPTRTRGDSCRRYPRLPRVTVRIGRRTESSCLRRALVVPFVGFPGKAARAGPPGWQSHATEFDVVHIHFGRDLMVLPVGGRAHRRRIPYVLQTRTAW